MTRLLENDKNVDQPIYQELSICSAFNDHLMAFTLLDVATSSTIVNKELHPNNVIISNVNILD